MKKISSKVQSLLRASNHINRHNKAVEELVYNALDADATSIAIRINIQENTIHVIDNGCGISNKDFKYMGHKYRSSKFTDLSSLKSAPNKYGFRGQSIANLVTVSKSLKVISRHEKSEETLLKLFEHGKEKEIKKCNLRPSAGTTVVVTGFLYNLNIQKTSKDILSDLQAIKTFLKHLSLVHCNISLSFRDDSKNEILFKMHKNRDIFQTISALYNINKKNLQELQVEKNNYKVTAYIGNFDASAGKHLIFLNERFILHSSKLHKIVNSCLSKDLKLRGIQKSKIKNNNTEENQLIPKNIPDYFIFIKCPHMDYDMSNSPKQSVLEFKDCDKINKLLDKLIKFYNGDLKHQKERNRCAVNENKETYKHENTREQVKKIIDRILGTNTKKTGIANMHNGITGKQVKRNNKRLSLKSVSKRTNQNNNRNVCKKLTDEYSTVLDQSVNYVNNSNILITTKENNIVKEKNHKNFNKEIQNVSKNKKSNKLTLLLNNKDKLGDKRIKSCLHHTALRKIETQTYSEKKRCDKLEKRTNYVLDQVHKKGIDKVLNENVQINNLAQNHTNVTVPKHIDEIINHKNEVCDNTKNKLVQSNYDLLQTILRSQQESNKQPENLPIELNNKADNTHSPRPEQSCCNINKPINAELESNTETMVTYKSHHYSTHQSIHRENNSRSHYRVQIQNDCHFNYHNRRESFLTKQSRDNFSIPNDGIKHNHFKKKTIKNRFSKQLQSHIKDLFKQTSKLFNMKKQIIEATYGSSVTIEFSKSNKYTLNYDKSLITPALLKNAKMRIDEIWPQSANHNHADKDNDRISINTATNFVPKDNNGYTINDDDYWTFHGTYAIQKNSEFISDTESQNQDLHIDNKSQSNTNFIFISKSQDDQTEHIMDPINICETILDSEEIISKEFEISFNKSVTKDNEEFLEINNSNEVVKKVHDEHAVYNISHHFSLPENGNERNEDGLNNKAKNMRPIDTSKQKTNIDHRIQQIQDKGLSELAKHTKLSDFNFMNRLCFIPKGMSPIFQNYQTENICEYNLSRDFYEKHLYKNFADSVRINAEIFDPYIQDLKESTSKAIEKVNTKLTKDNSDLKFDGHSLKNAKVLGQTDEKFIVTTMKEGCSNDPTVEFLVLFDQHAVHERIRLENNIKDYLNENQWKPTTIDAVVLKLSKDDVLYLHNYKDKFEQLGLQWTVTNSEEVSIGAIPEAILGKNPRQVEKVIKTIRNLITEEINIIKMQRGCVSLYPKSLMDLVFSEACRYAIKFGDKLSKSECVELIKSLSACKTPFQCAHGRPVMAVIMEVKTNTVTYKKTLSKIMEWKRKL